LDGSLIMKTFLFVTFLVMCLALVGIIEDPCSTEGLMAGCAD